MKYYKKSTITYKSLYDLRQEQLLLKYRKKILPTEIFMRINNSSIKNEIGMSYNGGKSKKCFYA